MCPLRRPSARRRFGSTPVMSAPSAHHAHHRPTVSLETLAYKYGTDKSKDDHKYVDLYHALFSDRRQRVLNLTEIGVSTGQSVAMWSDYFDRAHIWGFDPLLRQNKAVGHYFRSNPRVHLFSADAYLNTTPSRHSLMPETMDIIIDDAWHYPNPAMKLLAIWWPLLKPGGYYVIEDLSWDNNKDQQLSLLETTQLPEAKAILQSNAAFYVDTLLGHRNFSDFKNATGDSSEAGLKRPAQCCTRTRRLHNSHLVVIQRRDDSRPLRPYAPNLRDPRRAPMTNGWMELEENVIGNTD